MRSKKRYVGSMYRRPTFHGTAKVQLGQRQGDRLPRERTILNVVVADVVSNQDEPPLAGSDLSVRVILHKSPSPLCADGAAFSL
jgi:hypothetical protein